MRDTLTFSSARALFLVALAMVGPRNISSARDENNSTTIAVKRSLRVRQREDNLWGLRKRGERREPKFKSMPMCVPSVY